MAAGGAETVSPVVAASTAIPRATRFMVFSLMKCPGRAVRREGRPPGGAALAPSRSRAGHMSGDAGGRTRQSRRWRSILQVRGCPAAPDTGNGVGALLGEALT